MRSEPVVVGGGSRIVLELPPLPATEVLLCIIAILLLRGVWLLQEGVVLLSKIAGGDERSKTESAPATNLMANPEKAIAERTSPQRAPAPQARALRTSSAMFSQCLLDDDVDIAMFMDACRWYADKVCAPMGNFTVLMVREVHANMDKVKHTFQLNPARYRSMRALLDAETSSNMHQPVGLLADPSAAMGLLWARRGLLFWVSLFRQQAPKEGLAVASDVLAAYEEALAPYFGWVSSNTFKLATRAFPGWAAIQATWAADQADALEDMTEWLEVVEPLLETILRLLQALDLEDQRKCL